MLWIEIQISIPRNSHAYAKFKLSVPLKFRASCPPVLVENNGKVYQGETLLSSLKAILLAGV